MKLLVTGGPGSGKSTVFMKIVEKLRNKGLRIGGIVTPEIRVSEPVIRKLATILENIGVLFSEEALEYVSILEEKRERQRR